MSARRLEGLAVAGGLVGVAALFFAYPTYPNYDAYYHLVWGRELLDGGAPSFQAYRAPTQHPLYLALGALLSLVGGGADRALVAVALLSLLALVWSTYRLGTELFGRWPGIAAGAFAGSSFAFLLYAVRAYVDVPFLAVVVWAAALEARRPRAPAVLPLLAVAGLLRPEAWLLAGGYWLWRRRTLAGAAFVLVAPLVWSLTDLAVTGDPLYSLHATASLAGELGRDRGAGVLPGELVSFLAATVKPPIAVAALAGALLAWRLRARESLVLPAALLGIGTLTFLATGLAGLSILPRYLTVPALALCLLAGYATLGFTTLPAGDPLRRRWARAAGLAALAGVLFAALQAPSLGRLERELRFTGETHASLAELLRAPAVVAGMRCGPLTFPNYRLVPDARFILDAPRERVGARSARRRPYGVAVFVLGAKALRRFGFADGASPRTNVPDPGFHPVARTRFFSAYVRCPE